MTQRASRRDNMKEYTYTATRDFLQEYKITIKAKNEGQADDIIHSLRYNYNHEWTEVGDYEHQSYYIFNKKKSEWGYCKEFWGINKKDKVWDTENYFWDNSMENAISVYSEKEITNEQADTLQQLGVA